MPTRNYPYFSQPGWIPFAVLCTGAVVVWHFFGFGWSIPVWLACLALVFLFRDPEREVSSIPLAVVSPADGVIAAVETVSDPYLDRKATHVVIDMNHWGVFSTRSPVEGKIMDLKDCPAEGEQLRPHGVWIKTDENDDLIVAMYRGPMNSVPRCNIRIGDKIGQGQRCGFIRFGGRVDLYLPENSRLAVDSGSHLKAGTSVVATLVHK
jgi:phosphatidylserine decarboxylase